LCFLPFMFSHFHVGYVTTVFGSARIWNKLQLQNYWAPPPWTFPTFSITPFLLCCSI
jgi:hypothetical protein